MVFDETRDIRDALKRLGKFFAHESCGKCYPCQLGTQRQMEILNRVAEGSVVEGDFVRLQDVGWTMTDASLCGLGQTAASAVLSAMKLWPELFDRKVAGTAAASESPATAAPLVKMKATKIKTKPEAKKTGKTARPKSNLEKKTKRVQAKKPVKSEKPVRAKKPVKKTGSKK
jgi:hypothetical protein